MSKKTRQHVQKARRGNVTVEEITEAEKLGIVYKLINRVYSRARVPFPSFTLFQAAFDILFPRGMLRAVLARLDDQYVGANLVLTYKGLILDWYRGSDRSFSFCYPEPLMVWEILQWGRERGFHCFDFGGAGKPDEDYGPRIFKSRWGGTLVNYGRNTYIHAPIRLKLSRAGYQIAREFLWSKMSEQ
jgi:lipid II:glycine glycyltransferase (peptidoglycan interpeptide bridge formation enzyme)